MLVVSDLNKTFGAATVLTDISFQLDEGELVALVGPNGAGKSTLIHIMVGLIESTTGRIYRDGGLIHRGKGELESDLRNHLGFCPDDLPQAELLTGREYLDMVAGIRKLRRVSEAESALLEGMHLTEALGRLIVTYSHGMRRKLQVVAALLHRPSVFVLDEPFRGLDPESAAIVKTLLRVYADAGNTVLVSTHDLLVAQQLCDRVVMLREGRIVADAPMSDFVASRDGLEQAFMRMIGIDLTSQESSARFFEGLGLLGPGQRT